MEIGAEFPGVDWVAAEHVFTDTQLLVIGAQLGKVQETLGMGSKEWKELRRKIMDAMFFRGMAIIRCCDDDIPMCKTLNEMRACRIEARRLGHDELEAIQHKRWTLQRDDYKFYKEKDEDFAAWFSQL